MTQEDDTATKEFHKARSQRGYQKQIEGTEATAALIAFSDKEFGHIVKHAAKEDNFEPILAAAMLRLDQEQLSIQSLSLLLIHSGDLTLKHQILAVLQQRPEEATSVLVIAIDQEPSWEQLDYVEAGQVRATL